MRGLGYKEILGLVVGRGKKTPAERGDNGGVLSRKNRGDWGVIHSGLLS
jgi:hypothetical protein